MRYYIIKPRTASVQIPLIQGIMRVDPEAEFVDSVKKCELAVLQNGWTRSSYSLTEWDTAKRAGIKVREGYIYTDKYVAHLN